MNTLDRKDGHLNVVANGQANARTVTTGLERVQFVHCALPEVDLAEIDLGVQFLGHALAAPFLISSMTGGPSRARAINAALAEAAQDHGIAMAVGSQRVALQGEGSEGLDRHLRHYAPDIPLYANLGAAQLLEPGAQDRVHRAIDAIDANALIIHLNPMQEALQAGGDTRWRGVLSAIRDICVCLERPVIVKEVGFGLSGAVAAQLVDAGVAALDVAGCGGTSWAAVEGAMQEPGAARRLAELYRDWGIPTADAIVQVRAAAPAMPLIGSGGIRSGLDAARALRLGADIVGTAAGLLTAALEGPHAVHAAITEWKDALRLACFGTGSRTIADLRKAPLRSAPSVRQP
jgi:isopentenyl-diphosphate delta-isomerase